MVGILVHGDNHLIVRGPLPDRAAALALVRFWSLIQIGEETPVALRSWTISTRGISRESGVGGDCAGRRFDESCRRAVARGTFSKRNRDSRLPVEELVTKTFPEYTAIPFEVSAPAG